MQRSVVWPNEGLALYKGLDAMKIDWFDYEIHIFFFGFLFYYVPIVRRNVKPACGDQHFHTSAIGQIGFLVSSISLLLELGVTRIHPITQQSTSNTKQHRIFIY